MANRDVFIFASVLYVMPAALCGDSRAGIGSGKNTKYLFPTGLEVHLEDMF